MTPEPTAAVPTETRPLPPPNVVLLHRDRGGPVVTGLLSATGQPLPPTAHDWTPPRLWIGGGRRGPQALARALLTSAGASDREARRFQSDARRRFLLSLPSVGGTIELRAVRSYLAERRPGLPLPSPPTRASQPPHRGATNMAEAKTASPQPDTLHPQAAVAEREGYPAPARALTAQADSLTHGGNPASSPGATNMAEAKTTSPRRDNTATGIADPARYHSKFAQTAIAQIEAGTAPWQRTWKAEQPVLPRNAITGRRYTGGNAIYLATRGQDRNFTDNRWVTRKQLRDAGGTLARGAAGERILFRDESGKQPVWRTATVYNVEQTRGLDLQRRPPIPEWAGAQRAEAVIAASGVPIKTSGDMSYYDGKQDAITMPAPERFASQNDYHSEALRHVAHASGHAKRLNRPAFRASQDAGLDTKALASERLRVEIAAMVAADRLGVGYTPAAGKPNAPLWTEALKNDPREIHRAAAEAHRIVQHMVKPAREQLHQINQSVRAERQRGPEHAHASPTHSPESPPRNSPAKTGPAISPGR